MRRSTTPGASLSLTLHQSSGCSPRVPLTHSFMINRSEFPLHILGLNLTDCYSFSSRTWRRWRPPPSPPPPPRTPPQTGRTCAGSVGRVTPGHPPSRLTLGPTVGRGRTGQYLILTDTDHPATQESYLLFSYCHFLFKEKFCLALKE